MAAISTRRRQRRPSGDPPPLPRESKARRWLWATVAVIIVGIGLGVTLSTTDALDDLGDEVLVWFADVRTAFLTGIAKGVALVTSFGAVQILRLGVAVTLVITKRFRALVVALVSFVLVDWLVRTVLSTQRPAPSVTALVESASYSFPSWPMTAFAITVFAIPFVLAPAGRMRTRAMALAWVVVSARLPRPGSTWAPTIP